MSIDTVINLDKVGQDEFALDIRGVSFTASVFECSEGLRVYLDKDELDRIAFQIQTLMQDIDLTSKEKA